MPSYLKCLRALRAHMLYVLTCLCLRTFASHVSSFFYVPYVPSFFTHLHFCGFILYLYMLIKLTQINELTYVHLCYYWIQSSIKVYQVFSLLQSSCHTLHDSFLFLKRKMPTTFNTEDSTWPLERLEHYLEREIQGM